MARPKKEKTEGETGDKKKRKKKDKVPWKARQVLRMERALKYVEKLDAHFTAANAPNVIPALASNAHGQLKALAIQINSLPEDWKPAKGHRPGTSKRPGIGSYIMVKPDLNRDEVKTFKHISSELFTNARVIDDDGPYWLVKCADKVTRAVKKSLVTKSTFELPGDEPEQPKTEAPKAVA